MSDSLDQDVVACSSSSRSTVQLVYILYAINNVILMNINASFFYIILSVVFFLYFLF